MRYLQNGSKGGGPPEILVQIPCHLVELPQSGEPCQSSGDPDWPNFAETLTVQRGESIDLPRGSPLPHTRKSPTDVGHDPEQGRLRASSRAAHRWSYLIHAEIARPIRSAKHASLSNTPGPHHGGACNRFAFNNFKFFELSLQSSLHLSLAVLVRYRSSTSV